MEKRAIKAAVQDNVATVVDAVHKGETIHIYDTDHNLIQAFSVTESIPFGHKFALLPIGPGQAVVKYGCQIGTASHGIPCGALVHVHNVRSNVLNLPDWSIREIIRIMGVSGGN